MRKLLGALLYLALHNNQNPRFYVQMAFLRIARRLLQRRLSST
jgi:hypothetical protein